MLHVFLGASGYEDENYELSLAIILTEYYLDPISLTLPPDIDIKSLFPKIEYDLFKKNPLTSVDPLAEIAIDKNQTLLIAGGGGTGVGGGGDSWSSELKISLIIEANETFSALKNCSSKLKSLVDYFKLIQKLQIESSNTANEIHILQRNNQTNQIFIIPQKQFTAENISLQSTSLKGLLCVSLAKEEISP